MKISSVTLYEYIIFSIITHIRFGVLGFWGSATLPQGASLQRVRREAAKSTDPFPDFLLLALIREPRELL